MIYVPPLHAELMSTTALTPTYHGGIIRAIAGIAVAIAIPAFAPGIAMSIGLTGIIGPIAASAVVGGAIGALSAKVLGSDWRLGAIGGAIGGGLGGFAKSGGFSGIGKTPVQSGAGLGYGEFDAGFSGLNTQAASTVGLTTPTPVQSGAGFGLGEFDATIDLSEFAQPVQSFKGFVPGTATNQQLSGIDLPPPYTGGEVPMGYAGTPPIDTAKLSGLDSATQSGYMSLGGGGAPITNTPLQAGVMRDSGFLPEGSGYAPGSARMSPAMTSAPVTPPPESGFFDDFQGKLTRGVKRAFDPENLAQRGLEAAGKFGLSKAAEYFADEVPVSREEEQRLAFLDQQRAEQVRLQGAKEKIATGFLSQARGISGTGQDESNRAKIAAARAGRSFIRGGSQAPAAVASRRRQINLAAARAGGTAQRQGAESAARRRDALFSKAASTLPTGQELAKGAVEDLAAADKRFLRQQQEQGQFSDIFGGLLPTGAKTAAERAEEIKKELGL